MLKRYGLLLVFTLLATIAQAGVGDCLKAALSAANPKDLERAAAFATGHPTCLTNLAPPYLVPYTALSGSLDFANQSGALNKVGLGFGNDYGRCVANTEVETTAVKKLAPVLKPVCDPLNLDCAMLDGPAADQANSQLVKQFPLLGMMPCACAAATSGLGVQKIADTLKATRECGATLAEAGKVLSDAAQGTYALGAQATQAASDAATKAAQELGKIVGSASGALGTAYCSVAGVFGACSKSAPPTPFAIATSWCKARGGMAEFASTSNQPNDFHMRCNDGTECRVQPNKAAECMTAADKTARKAADAQRNDDQVKTNTAWCAARTQQLKNAYNALCRDATCKMGIFLLVADFSARCLQNNGESTNFPAELWAVKGEAPNIVKMDKLVAESIDRTAATKPKAPPGLQKFNLTVTPPAADVKASTPGTAAEAAPAVIYRRVAPTPTTVPEKAVAPSKEAQIQVEELPERRETPSISTPIKVRPRPLQ